jgi:hypothetical protein
LPWQPNHRGRSTLDTRTTDSPRSPVASADRIAPDAMAGTRTHHRLAVGSLQTLQRFPHSSCDWAAAGLVSSASLSLTFTRLEKSHSTSLFCSHLQRNKCRQEQPGTKGRRIHSDHCILPARFALYRAPQTTLAPLRQQSNVDRRRNRGFCHCKICPASTMSG